MKIPLLFVPFLMLLLFGSCERHSLEETAPAREFEKHHAEKIEAAKAEKEGKSPGEEPAH